MTEQLKINQINRNGGTQVRSRFDEPTIQRYKEIWEARETLPPVVVFFDGTEYWLADGFHRVQALEIANIPIPTAIKSIPVSILTGTQRDAIRYALSANAEHGLPRSPEDMRRAVCRMLDDQEWSKLTNVQIAKDCAVSEALVRKIKKEREPKSHGAISEDLDNSTPIRPNDLRQTTSQPSADLDTSKVGATKFHQTELIPEEAEIGDVLAVVPDCPFKVGDRVIDLAEDKRGEVVNLKYQQGTWKLVVKLDSGFELTGAAETFASEPKVPDVKSHWIEYFVLAKPDNQVAVRGKKAYSSQSLNGAIETGTLMTFINKEVAETEAKKEGYTVKRMVVTLEDC